VKRNGRQLSHRRAQNEIRNTAAQRARAVSADNPLAIAVVRCPWHRTPSFRLHCFRQPCCSHHRIGRSCRGHDTGCSYLPDHTGVQVRNWGGFLFWLLGGILYGIAGLTVFYNPLLGAAVLTLVFAWAWAIITHCPLHGIPLREYRSAAFQKIRYSSFPHQNSRGQAAAENAVHRCQPRHIRQ
jgi:hypothetical protein